MNFQIIHEFPSSTLKSAGNPPFPARSFPRMYSASSSTPTGGGCLKGRGASWSVSSRSRDATDCVSCKEDLTDAPWLCRSGDRWDRDWPGRGLGAGLGAIAGLASAASALTYEFPESSCSGPQKRFHSSFDLCGNSGFKAGMCLGTSGLRKVEPRNK